MGKFRRPAKKQRREKKERERPVDTAAAERKKKASRFNPLIHWLPAPVPLRQHEPCPISGRPIDDIRTAMCHHQSGQPARFDAVLASIAAQEKLAHDERLAYIGQGVFGIIKMQKDKAGKAHLVLRKIIPYETENSKPEWRRSLSPGISRDYTPNPQPLAELYTREEILAFPRFDVGGASHSARDN